MSSSPATTSAGVVIPEKSTVDEQEYTREQREREGHAKGGAPRLRVGRGRAAILVWRARRPFST
ncbi:hypothetical protein [Sorangium sp. So ce204]|uniref:hypothetical protein n=1 Tax=Sorangium sp. So ce204 TaxID=3133288 RepID=UPI003F63D640